MLAHLNVPIERPRVEIRSGKDFTDASSILSVDLSQYNALHCANPPKKDHVAVMVKIDRPGSAAIWHDIDETSRA